MINRRIGRALQMLLLREQETLDERLSIDKDNGGSTNKDEGEEDEVSQTALEWILSTLPAARREICLHIRAISGLGQQPFHARWNPVLAKIFWGRQEVSTAANP